MGINFSCFLKLPIFFKTKLQASFGIFWYTLHMHKVLFKENFQVIFMAHEIQNSYAHYRKAYLYRKEIDRCNIRIKAMKD